jgi:hypothetical protein
MDSVIQHGRAPEWRLAFEDRLDEAARARVRSAVKNGEGVDEPNQAPIAAGLARREQRRVLLLGWFCSRSSSGSPCSGCASS